MTTIAYKDGIIAADTLHSSHGSRVTFFSKIGRSPWAVDGLDQLPFIFGTTGTSADCAIFRKAAVSGQGLSDLFRNDAPPLECTALIVTKNRKIWLWERNREPLQVIGPVREDFFAVGSGSELAMGAMAAGATAREAVQIARIYDMETGGGIEEINLDSSDDSECRSEQLGETA